MKLIMKYGNIVTVLHCRDLKPGELTKNFATDGEFLWQKC